MNILEIRVKRVRRDDVLETSWFFSEKAATAANISERFYGITAGETACAVAKDPRIAEAILGLASVRGVVSRFSSAFPAFKIWVDVGGAEFSFDPRWVEVAM